MTEKDMWRALYSSAGAYAHMTRVENAASFGMPDVNVAYEGEEFWLELKIAVSQRIKIRQTQLAWIIKRNQFTSNIFFLVYHDNAYYIYHPTNEEIKDSLISHSGTLYLSLRKMPQFCMVSRPYKWIILFEEILIELQERRIRR